MAGGDAYVDPSLSPTLLMDPGAPDAPLAEREREILQLLAEGLHTDEVAQRIGLSSETVKADTKRADGPAGGQRARARRGQRAAAVLIE